MNRAQAMPALTTSTSSFRFAQWRMLLAAMLCYLFFYTGRQTFGFAIPGIQAEFGFTKEHLGWVSAAMLWAYAIGQTINGNLADKFGGRRIMTLGAREKSSRTRQLVEESCKRLDVDLNCIMQLNSREAIVHAITKGIGIGFVSAVEYAQTPGTKPITFVNHPFSIDYHLCCLGIRRNRPMIAELFDSSPTPSI
jgi:hypothetical protein